MPMILSFMVIASLLSVPVSITSAEEQPLKSANPFKTVTLNVQKMDCPMCRITIRKALEKVEGVNEALVDFDAKTAKVTFDPGVTTIDALTHATTNAGYPSTLKTE